MLQNGGGNKRPGEQNGNNTPGGGSAQNPTLRALNLQELSRMSRKAYRTAGITARRRSGGRVYILQHRVGSEAARSHVAPTTSDLSIRSRGRIGKLEQIWLTNLNRINDSRRAQGRLPRTFLMLEPRAPSHRSVDTAGHDVTMDEVPLAGLVYPGLYRPSLRLVT